MAIYLGSTLVAGKKEGPSSGTRGFSVSRSSVDDRINELSEQINELREQVNVILQRLPEAK